MSFKIMEDYQEIICKNCGSKEFTELPDEALRCDYCKTLYTKIEAERDVRKRNEYCRKANKWIEFGDNGRAVDVFQEFSTEFPYEYRGWYGLSTLVDWDIWFYQQDPQKSPPPLPEYCNRALSQAPDKMKKEINIYYNKMRHDYQDKAVEKRRNYEKNKEKYNNLIKINNKTRSAFVSTNKKLSDTMPSYKSKNNDKLFGAGFKIVLSLLMVIYVVVSTKSCVEDFERDRMNYSHSEDFVKLLIGAAIILFSLGLVWLILGGLFRSISNGKVNSNNRKREKMQGTIQENNQKIQKLIGEESDLDNKLRLLEFSHDALMNASYLKKNNKI